MAAQIPPLVRHREFHSYSKGGNVEKRASIERANVLRADEQKADERANEQKKGNKAGG